jgi:hypothetical protein
MIEIEHSAKGKWVPYRLPAPLDGGKKGFWYLTFGNHSRGGVSIQDVRCGAEDADGIAVHGAGNCRSLGPTIVCCCTSSIACCCTSNIFVLVSEVTNHQEG